MPITDPVAIDVLDRRLQCSVRISRPTSTKSFGLLAGLTEGKVAPMRRHLAARSERGEKGLLARVSDKVGGFAPIS
jgi:hypothetical protein